MILAPSRGTGPAVSTCGMPWNQAPRSPRAASCDSQARLAGVVCMAVRNRPRSSRVTSAASIGSPTALAVRSNHGIPGEQIDQDLPELDRRTGRPGDVQPGLPDRPNWMPRRVRSPSSLVRSPRPVWSTTTPSRRSSPPRRRDATLPTGSAWSRAASAGRSTFLPSAASRRWSSTGTSAIRICSRCGPVWSRVDAGSTSSRFPPRRGHAAMTTSRVARKLRASKTSMPSRGGARSPRRRRSPRTQQDRHGIRPAAAALARSKAARAAHLSAARAAFVRASARAAPQPRTPANGPR